VEDPFQELLRTATDSKGSLIPLLQRTQELYGYLPVYAMEEIARAAGLSSAEVYGVATFYSQFSFSPKGRHTVKVCHGTACHVNGAESIDTALKTELGVESGETTRDNLFTVERVACLGCCSLAPVVMVDKQVEGRLNWARLLKTIKRIQADEG
jgi:NADH-quinone oxidoreductase subunit E